MSQTDARTGLFKTHKPGTVPGKLGQMGFLMSYRERKVVKKQQPLLSAKFKNKWNSTSTPPCAFMACSETILISRFMVREVVRHAVVQCASKDEIYTPSQYVFCQLVEAILRHPVLFAYWARINSVVFSDFHLADTSLNSHSI